MRFSELEMSSGVNTHREAKLHTTDVRSNKAAAVTGPDLTTENRNR